MIVKFSQQYSYFLIKLTVINIEINKYIYLFNSIVYIHISGKIIDVSRITDITLYL